MRLLVALVVWLAATPVALAGECEPDQSVILLHGLGRTARSMATLEERLVALDYAVRNLGYPSMERPVDELVGLIDAELERCCARDQRIHFVTHSLGGILVRAYLMDRKVPNLGRVVMLSPPNRGSELADVIRESAWLRKVLGPAAAQLGTDPESVPRTLPPIDFELGVITGDRSFNPLFSWLIPGPDDGKVAVERAKTPGMTDFLVVPSTHTFIMDSPEVAAQTHRFLQGGAFHHTPPNPDEESP